MGDSIVKIVEQKTVTQVAISGPLIIHRINEVMSGLLKALSLGKKVQVSLAAVTDVDLTGLQLLCSVHRTSIASELAFSVSSCGCEPLSSVEKVAAMLRRIGCPQEFCGACVWKREPVAGQVLE